MKRFYTLKISGRPWHPSNLDLHRGFVCCHKLIHLSESRSENKPKVVNCLKLPLRCSSIVWCDAFFANSLLAPAVQENTTFPNPLGMWIMYLHLEWVCDGCNNYLARKVEAPFMEAPYTKAARFEMQIPNKRDIIHPAIGLHPQSRSKIAVSMEEDGSPVLKS